MTTGNEVVEVKFDTQAVESLFRRSPSAVYYSVRRFLFGALLAHRLYWLKAKGTKFGRGDDKSNAVKVWRINEAPTGVAKPNWVTFTVGPPERRRADPDAAAAGLQQMAAVTGTGSIVLKVHQEGATTVSARWMAIPVRTRPGSPKRWRAANPGKDLVVIRDRSKSDRLWLAERVRKMRAGRKPRKGSRRKRVFDKLRKRFLLVHTIRNKPTLRFYESWDALVAGRDKEWRQACDLMLKEVDSVNAT